MKRILWIMLFHFAGITLWGQVITGVVLDSNTGEAIDFASVFFAGSSNHFFRALWSNTLVESGFRMLNYRTGGPVDYENLVFLDHEGYKFMAYKEDLEIRYYDNISYISFISYQVHFGKDGYFDPTPIIWSGTMSKQRIADFLPYEYIPGE